MNTPSFQILAALATGEKGIIVTLLAGLAILALGRGVNLPAREVYREMQTRQLEEDAQWVAERLERRMNTRRRSGKRPGRWRRCAPISIPSPGSGIISCCW
jgi:hypothetical protein